MVQEREIVVYSGVRCPDCDLVKSYLKERDIPFVEKNIHKNKAYRQELIGMGFKSIPVTLIGEQVIQGFDRDKLREVLGVA
jgi:glutaredoxin